jgi:hypothetical protein
MSLHTIENEENKGAILLSTFVDHSPQDGKSLTQFDNDALDDNDDDDYHFNNKEGEGITLHLLDSTYSSESGISSLIQTIQAFKFRPLLYYNLLTFLFL